MGSKSWPIIVGGCHRSGTSLIRRVLNAHSHILCGPEVKFFRDLYGAYPQDPVGHLRFLNTARGIVAHEDLLEVLGGAYVLLQERAAARAGKVRWADKCPENVLHLADWEHLLGDEWLFVHVVRNPLDTLASMADAGFELTLPPDLAGRIAHYRQYTAAGLRFGVDHPHQYYRVVYEQLVQSPEPELMALMQWLGETLEPRQLAFNEVRHLEGLEDPKVAKTSGVHARSVGRWPSLLSAKQGRVVWEATCDLWQQIDPDGSTGVSCHLPPATWRDKCALMRRFLFRGNARVG